jgi:hypothetical protein
VKNTGEAPMQTDGISSTAEKVDFGVVLTPSQFETRQNSAKKNLYAAMHEKEFVGKVNVDPFFEDKTRWLPGPLSYPWVLILLGIPHMLNLLAL